MECEICFLTFDTTSRRPKFLLCGHSACLACLERLSLKRCPVCRVEFTGPAKNLPDNFSLLRPAESTRRQPKMWCSCCETVAKAECLDNHNLKSVCAVLKGEMAQLQSREVKLVKKLTEAFSQANEGGKECAAERALQVLRLARQPGTSFQFTVRGPGGGEALKANWNNAPTAPGTDSEAVEAVMAGLLGLALAKKGCLQQDDQQTKRHSAQGVVGAGQAAGQAAALAAAQAAGQAVAQAALAALAAQAGQGRQGAAGVILELKVDHNPTDQRMEEILQTARQHRVRRLANLNCSVDGAWSMQLLQLVAPHVEELSAKLVLREQLLVIHNMLKLRRLKVYGTTSEVEDDNYDAPLPEPPARRAGLRWMSVAYLDHRATLCLIASHAATLEELWLAVGTVGGMTWPDGWGELHARLNICGFRNLQKLVLVRPKGPAGLTPPHSQPRCVGQLRALRRVLPQTQILCDLCDSVTPGVTRSF